jgi:hypothetical protein
MIVCAVFRRSFLQDLYGPRLEPISSNMARIQISRSGTNLANKNYKYAAFAAAIMLVSQVAQSRGVSPYLPLNLSPAIERQIERVLLLAGKPVMRRPIPTAVVLDALPAACKQDRVLCEEVSSYLQLYMKSFGLVSAQIEAATSDGESDMTMPNSHGRSVRSSWQANVSAFYQPSDYILVNAGGIAYDGSTTPTGSFLSFGFDFAQLDIGYRDHWLSPLSDSSSLISTEASTMPSITLSNYDPITPLGFGYEIFAAEMSWQDNIYHADGPTSGHPRLAGMQVMMEPVTGYALAINRETQYGGGARGGTGFSDFYHALFTNGNDAGTGSTDEIGNQVASLTSSILFPGRIPFGVHIEYGGEDNAYSAGSYRLADTSLSAGIDFPELWHGFDATAEVSEWQNGWYVHHIYPKGLTNEDHVIGHWFGDQREFGDGVGGTSAMLRLGWHRVAGEYWRATYRTLYLNAGWRDGLPDPGYERLQEIELSFSDSWNGFPFQLAVATGKDVFGDKFARFAASLDLAKRDIMASAVNDDYDAGDARTELFVDTGVQRTTLYKIFFSANNRDALAPEAGYHLGAGARRQVAEHSDLGVRIELDNLDGNELWSLRMLDYRYRMGRHFAVNGFFGIGRYEAGLPSHGYYMGAGLQYMNLMPGWDVSVDLRHHEKIGRDRVLSSDPPAIYNTPRIYFDADGVALYLSRHF